jgi:hypothetical protein
VAEWSKAAVLKTERGDAPDTHESKRKQGQIDRDDARGEAPESAPTGPNDSHAFYVGTIKDDSRDALEAALARALDRATEAGQWEVVKVILAQVERRGRG